MEPRKRALSVSAASECEQALGSVCHCRCGGALHGAKRVSNIGELPLNDPHSPSSQCPNCKGTGKNLGFEWVDGEMKETERDCWKCKGHGKILTRKVLKDIQKMRTNNSANYEVVSSDSEKVVLRDIGPWDKFYTITNASDKVVEELAEKGLIRDGIGLFYYDSEGEYGELQHEGGKFKGFKYAEAAKAL